MVEPENHHGRNGDPSDRASQRFTAFEKLHDELVEFLDKCKPEPKSNLCAAILLHGFCTINGLAIGPKRLPAVSAEKDIVRALKREYETGWANTMAAFVGAELRLLESIGLIVQKEGFSLTLPERLQEGDPRRTMIEKIIALHKAFPATRPDDVVAKSQSPSQAPHTPEVQLNTAVSPEVEAKSRALVKITKDARRVCEKLIRTLDLSVNESDSITALAHRIVWWSKGDDSAPPDSQAQNWVTSCNDFCDQREAEVASKNTAKIASLQNKGALKNLLHEHIVRSGKLSLPPDITQLEHEMYPEAVERRRLEFAKKWTVQNVLPMERELFLRFMEFPEIVKKVLDFVAKAEELEIVSREGAAMLKEPLSNALKLAESLRPRGVGKSEMEFYVDELSQLGDRLKAGREAFLACDAAVKLFLDSLIPSGERQG